MLMGPSGWLGPQPDVPVVSMIGYEYWPQSLDATIRRAWDRTGGKTPLLVTENGLATAEDADRIRYVDEALRGVHGCLADGIDVLGYTYWSLLDNFEWTYGYTPKFGIVAVDGTTFERTPEAERLVVRRGRAGECPRAAAQSAAQSAARFDAQLNGSACAPRRASARPGCRRRGGSGDPRSAVSSRGVAHARPEPAIPTSAPPSPTPSSRRRPVSRG